VDRKATEKLLRDVKAGRVPVADAVQRLRRLPFEDLGFARLDHHRPLRCGAPEVIFCQNKTTEQVVSIFGRLAAHGHNVLASRATPEVAAAVRAEFPKAEYHAAARAIVLRQGRRRRPAGRIVIVSAGTADMPVAEEARVTAELMGNCVEAQYDVGVAGLHRLLAAGEMLQRAKVIVVVAGMEGALASVVGGLVSAPVIAVPTSVGYGASFGGVAPLLTMLNSCASGVAVVNIDNGFGAGYIASQINHLASGRQ
jgi:NCAIR mutase (PurE)-related protein